MARFNRILAVSNPRNTRHPAVERGVLLAGAFDAELRVQSVVFRPLGVASLFHLDEDAERQERDSLISREQARLDGLMSVMKTGPRTSSDVYWGHPFDSSLLDVVKQFAPDLVILEPRGLERNRMSHGDWRFVRDCPVPILLARSGPWPISPAVAACVDPVHDSDDDATLDRRLIDTASQIADKLHGALTVVHAYGQPPEVIRLAQAPEKYDEDIRAGRLKRIKQAAPDLAEDAVKLIPALPADALYEYARRESPDLLVIGSIARTRLKEVLIGSTVRLVLPEVECDVLLLR